MKELDRDVTGDMTVNHTPRSDVMAFRDEITCQKKCGRPGLPRPHLLFPSHYDVWGDNFYMREFAQNDFRISIFYKI